MSCLALYDKQNIGFVVLAPLSLLTYHVVRWLRAYNNSSVILLPLSVCYPLPFPLGVFRSDMAWQRQCGCQPVHLKSFG